MKSNELNPDLSKLLKHCIVLRWLLVAGLIFYFFLLWLGYGLASNPLMTIIFLFLLALNEHTVMLHKKLIELFSKNST